MSELIIFFYILKVVITRLLNDAIKAKTNRTINDGFDSEAKHLTIENDLI